MTTPELLLAAALLMAPLESPVPPVTPENWPVLQENLRQYAIEIQLLDKRETEFLLVKPEELKADLAILRRRFQDLKETPRVENPGRFPSRDEVNGMLTFNRNYRSKMEAKSIAEPHKADFYRTAIAEADKLHQIWDAVRDVRCDFYYIPVRRQALKKLKDLVGDEAYHTGNLPPCVPTWRFQEIK